MELLWVLTRHLCRRFRGRLDSAECRSDRYAKGRRHFPKARHPCEASGIIVSSLSRAPLSLTVRNRAHIPDTDQITGAVLNMSYFHVPGTPPSEKHYLFGPPTSFEATCTALGLDVLAQIPIEPDVSTQGDRGTPVVLRGTGEAASASEAFRQLAAKVWSRL